MIWGILIVLVAALMIYVCTPLFRARNGSALTGDGIQEYRQKLEEVEASIARENGDASELLATRTALERKLLDHLDEDTKEPVQKISKLFIPLIAIIGLSTVLLYQKLGSPNLTNVNADQTNNLEDLPLDQLVLRLEQNLANDPANPNAWVLYARSLMTLGRYDEALTAYDRVIALTNSDEKIVAERASAVRYVDQIRVGQAGPSASDIETASAMTAEERAAMVQNMVDGLSAKLAENPQNELGWIRLLKARRVLGQNEEAEEEVQRMRDAFAESPETIERILTAVEQDIP